MIPITTLRPFTRCLMTIGQIPTSYLISMSYEEQLLWLCNYLEKEVIPALNNNAEAVKEVQELYEELKSYVDNYFENLDVQEEINNKLDEMAEGGQLADIIAQYLGLAGVLAYDTISDMASALNIDEGSICRTLGETTYNDGKGAFYKVRTITSDDTIDGVNIVALSASNTLIAEKMPDYYINAVNNRIDKMLSKKILFIGDSYLVLGNGTNGIIDKFKTITGENNVLYSIYSGVGFKYTVDNKNFITLLNDVPNDNDITDIIVVGGYNDQYSDQTDVVNNIGTFCSTAKTKFPNASVYIAMAGFTQEASKRYAIYTTYVSYSQCNKFGANFLSGVECVMHDTSLFVGDPDFTHPNENGREKLAIAIAQAWKTGRYSYNIGYTLLPLTLSGLATSGNFQLNTMIIDNKTYILNQGVRTINFASEPDISDIHLAQIEIATLTVGQAGALFSPWPYNMYPIPVTCSINQTGGWITLNGKMQFVNNKVYLVFEDAQGNNWTDLHGLKTIEINTCQGVFPTQIC